MDNILNLIKCIFVGDFGLITMVPRYLFTILLPTMVILNLITFLLPKLGNIPVVLSGLGCTTAALSALTTEKNSQRQTYLIYLLVFIIPCSAQLTLLISFASIVSAKLLFGFFIIFLISSTALYLIIKIVTNSNLSEPKTSATRSLSMLIKDAFFFVIEAAPAFSLGSLVVSLFNFFEIFDWFSIRLEGFFIHFMGLPRQAANIFILNIFKRDFSSASLLALERYFSIDQLMEILLMLIFSVPCFNSVIMLIRIKKLPNAIIIWFGSFVISIFLGKLFRCIFSICFI